MAATQQTPAGTVTDDTQVAGHELYLPGIGFQGAQWIAAPLSVTDTPDDGNLSYTIETTLAIPGESATIVFGYHPSDHRMYRLQMQRGEGAESVRYTLEMVGGREEVWHLDLDAPAVIGDRDLVRGDNCWQFHVRETSLDISLNDTVLWQDIALPAARDADCGMGFYCWREDVLYVDDLTVTDEQGTVLLAEDFSEQKEETYYNGVVAHTEDGRMIATSMMRLFYAKDAPSAQAPCFQYPFVTDAGKVESAFLHITALGLYEAKINGQPVTDTVLNPGNAPYHIRPYYQSYDVTHLLKDGDNVIEVLLGRGWYNGAVFQTVGGQTWGDRNALLCTLSVTYDNGVTADFVSDGDWRVSLRSSVIYDDIWQGQIVDARITPDYMTYAEVIDPFADEIALTAQSDPYIRITEVRTPVDTWETSRGTVVYDFGQEITGVCKIKMHGTEGAQITLTHGEWINEENLSNADGPPGTVFTRNLLGAQQADRYILNGDAGGEVFFPAMTFHGFRYMELETAGDVTVDAVEAVAFSSNLRQTGTLHTSDERINRLYQNITASIRGNFLSVPMDCPQRTERYGWTGDAQLIQSAAMYAYDVNAFYAGFEQDILDVQDPVTGRAPDMAPRNFGTDENGRGGQGGANGWGDAIVLIPWRLYLQYGKTEVIENAYDGMSAWIGCLVAGSDNYLRPDNGYGDHLTTGSNPHALINTAWSAHVCDLMHRMALILQKEDDAERFRTYFKGFRDAWLAQFVTDGAVTADGAQIGYLLGLAFDLYPEEMREQAANHFVTSLTWTGEIVPRIGFAGAAYLLPVLCDAGYTEIAYHILESEEAGAWLYQVAHGATSMWELWDTLRFAEDGTYAIVGSLNHPALGSVGAWMYAYMAGIRPDEEAPGYRHFFLQPAVGGTLTFAEASYLTAYGEIAVRWDRIGDTVRYVMTVPEGTTATFLPPAGATGADAMFLTAGTYEVTFELP